MNATEVRPRAVAGSGMAGLGRLLLGGCLFLAAACVAPEPAPSMRVNSPPAAPTARPGDTATPVADLPAPGASATAAAWPTVASVPSPAPAATPAITATATITRVVVPILMYHHLNALPDGASSLLRGMTVTPAEFDQQMAYLAGHNYHTVMFGDLAAYFATGRALPANPVIVTFDDAWAIDYTVAYPALRRHGLIATFFPPIKWIGRSSSVLNWDQIAEMSSHGMEFGSHGYTHSYLTHLAPDALAKELADSKTALEQHTGRPVAALAYPLGAYNPTVIEATRQAGYAAAVTIEPGIWARRDGLYSLRRLGVPYGLSERAFAAMLRRPGPGEEALPPH